MTVHLYAHGMQYVSVCAPSDLTIDEVVTQANARITADLADFAITPDLDLVLSKDETFKSGESNPCPCEQVADRQHWLLER